MRNGEYEVMKKSISIILAIVFSLLSVNCSAAQDIENYVFAENVTVTPDTYVTVPVCIENNSGFMGFSITVTYPQEDLTPISVEKGSTLSGILNDSISTSANNSFKVVYTGISDIYADCCLFNVTFKVAENAADRVNWIELSYSQPDTFKEGWEDAELFCNPFYINVINEQSSTVVNTTVPNDEGESMTSVGEITTEHDFTEEEPSEQPDYESERLSVRMRNWVNSLAFPLNILAGIFVIPVSYVVSIFE